MITQRIKAKSKELLGYEISQEELRLMVYILDVMMNSQRLNISVLTADERPILTKWREAKYVDGGASGMNISKKFWDAVCGITFLGYVDIN